MLKDWMRKVALNKNLRGEDYRVLLFLLSNADGTTVEISQAEIARSLEYKQPRVSRALKRLDEFKIIKKIFIAGKLVGYRFLIEEPNQV
ncbi:MAG: helix-turn-helix domain-containing protein [Xenococcaceae cyanobacterium MO_188.B29]|nr:helix-turn-helix domain-containing protein [Xenococcaceae cyanobacterium MO_188.B29]